MKVYTDAECDLLYQETLSYERIDLDIWGFDEVVTAKSQWSEEEYRFAQLSSGIELDLIDEQIFCDRNCLGRHGQNPALIAKFYLSGYHSVICPGVEGIPSEYTEVGGQNYLFYLPNIEEIEQNWAGDRWKMLRLEISIDTIKQFVTELNSVPQQLRPLIEDKNPSHFHFNVGRITVQMEMIIKQIWQHPYQGAIARIYLEAKVLELLALQLSQLSESKPELVKSTLKPQNIDRVYQAREILATQLENPPLISQLALQVEISERTLRSGFQEVFNTTVVGYINLLRMEKAELLLRERKLSISEVANLVGYSHLGNFSTAFKRQFGITPSQCMAGKKSFSS